MDGRIDVLATVTVITQTWMYLRELRNIAKLEIFLSSNDGSWPFSISKHSFRCARRFFSSLLWTSRVPEFLLLMLLLLLLLLELFLKIKKQNNLF